MSGDKRGSFLSIQGTTEVYHLGAVLLCFTEMIVANLVSSVAKAFS